MQARFKRIVKQSKWALIGYTIARSSYGRFRFSRGRIDSLRGSTHLSLSVADSVAYINRVYEDYLKYGQLAPDRLPGKSILEIGPGDNLGVALRFVAAGAVRVVAMDPYCSRQDSEQQRQIYLALRRYLNDEQKQRYDRAVDLSTGVVFNQDLVKSVYGKGIEESDDAFDSSGFDMIVSRAVIQEIHDTDRAFASMDRVLRPGGIMLHKIDLRDYSLFSGNGHHPLEFLTIPDSVYELMARDAAWPSRKTVDYYRKKMADYDYNAAIYITAVTQWGYARPERELLPHKTRLEYGVDYTDDAVNIVRSIRPRLERRFSHISDEDLMVAGIFLVARKR
jgi:SAM-dependent methyltransferase